MRNKLKFLIAATVIAAPASAQNSVDPAANIVAANEASTGAAVEPANVAATDPAMGNVVAGDTVATPAPGEAVDTAYAEPERERDRGGFPWGVLGLLGLLGLIPRKPAERR